MEPGIALKATPVFFVYRDKKDRQPLWRRIMNAVDHKA